MVGPVGTSGSLLLSQFASAECLEEIMGMETQRKLPGWKGQQEESGVLGDEGEVERT